VWMNRDNRSALASALVVVLMLSAMLGQVASAVAQKLPNGRPFPGKIPLGQNNGWQKGLTPPPCVQTPAEAIRTIAGAHLRFAIPLQAAPGISARYKASTPDLANGIHQYPAVVVSARPDTGYLGNKHKQDLLFLDVYTTVDAAPGESLVIVPLDVSGSLKGCQAVTSLMLRLEVIEPYAMAPSELKWVQERLELGQLFTYEHRDFLKRPGSNRSPYQMVGFETLIARPELRDPALVRYVDGDYFTDAQGNLGRLGDLSRVRHGWAPLHYGITRFTEGGHLLAIDADEDGVADLIAGGRFVPGGRTGRFWLETNNLGRALFECLGAGRDFTPGLLAEMQDSISSTGQGPCFSLLDSGGVPVTLPGADLVGPPDCSVTPDLGAVSGPGGSTRVPTPREAAEAAIEAEQRETERDILDGFDDEPTESSSGNALDAAAETVEQVLTPVQVELDNTSFRIRLEPSLDSPMVIFEFRERIRPPLPPGPTQPPVGPDGTPDGSFSDPRCVRRATDAARGTLFTDPQFCGGSNMLECLRRQEDSILDITGGNCERVEGPAGGEILSCGDNSPLFPDCDAGAGTLDCASRCPADQPRCLNVLPGSSSTPYISMTPLGAMLETLCRADCPSEPF